jgi:hypothetical protein
LVAPGHTLSVCLSAFSIWFNQILFFSILLAVADFAILWLMPVLKLRIIRITLSFYPHAVVKDHLSVTAAYEKRLTGSNFL